MGLDPFIGEIGTFTGSYAPEGWADCNGQSFNIQQNPALYAILGNRYGGDGHTTFKVPDLRPEVDGVKVDWQQVDQPRQCIALVGAWPTRP